MVRQCGSPPAEGSAAVRHCRQWKGMAVQAIALVLRRPLYRLEPACDPFALAEILALLGADAPCVLWIDRPSDTHIGVVRWLLYHERPSMLVVFTTDFPYKLPMDYLRADAVESVWHFDLPNGQQRCALWHAFIPITGDKNIGYDAVRWPTRARCSRSERSGLQLSERSETIPGSNRVTEICWTRSLRSGLWPMSVTSSSPGCGTGRRYVPSTQCRWECGVMTVIERVPLDQEDSYHRGGCPLLSGSGAHSSFSLALNDR